MKLIKDPADAIVFAPDLPRTFEPERQPWEPPVPEPLVVSVTLHAPSYQDDVPAGSTKPMAMMGGVGRETGEPHHGQVARLSQWDFGLTVGLWRLLDIAERSGVPVAVALDAYGVRTMPGLASLTARRAQEIVVRGIAANIVVSEKMTADEERVYISEATTAVAGATGTSPVGWFSPERAETTRTPALLREAGYEWFGDWPVDERPITLAGAAEGLVALPHMLDAEDIFSLYTRGMSAHDYGQILDDTVDQLICDAATTGRRFLGINLFGWVSGQACFAGVAERLLTRLAHHPDVRVALPSEIAAW
ncbi:MAG: hypothetical protein LKI24_11575 [Acidipropionibacterium sp.]|jgi:hypothetical protein|nr:hypothetical protein [Acidipropionibacterium sp.]